MKTIFNAILFLAATSAVACGGAPIESEEPAAKETTAAAPSTTAEAPSTTPEESKTETENVRSDTVYRPCTLVQLRRCIAMNPGVFVAACEIINGAPVCLFE